METRTGTMPVCGVVLLLILTLMSIRAWQGADLAVEFSYAFSNSNVLNIDRELEELRTNLRSSLGFALPDDSLIDLRVNETPPALRPEIQATTDTEIVSADPDHLPAAQERLCENPLAGLRNYRHVVRSISPPTQTQSPTIQELIDSLSDPFETVGAEAISKPVIETESSEKAIAEVTTEEFNNPTAWPNESAPQWPEMADANLDKLLSEKTPPIQSVLEGRDEDSAHDLFLISAPSESETTVAESEVKVVSDVEIPNQTNKYRPTKVARRTSKKAAARTPWTVPQALIRDIEPLSEHALLARWSQVTIKVLTSLKNLKSLDDANAEIIFQQLENQLNDLQFLVVQASTTPVNSAHLAEGELSNYLRHVAYSLRRRLEIWPVIYHLSKQTQMNVEFVEGHHVGQFLHASRSRLNTSEVERGWADYLLLDDATKAFNSLSPNRRTQKTAARAVLARLYSPSLSVSQKNYLATSIDPKTVSVLKSASIDPVDFQDILRRIEKLEWQDAGASRFYLNDSYQNLVWSDEPGLNQLAFQLETHYRNANFRVSVSERLLNRMVPQLPDTREPYRDRFMGANLVGQNKISNELQISLVPDPDRISMRLESFGQVESRTTATRSGVVIENEGSSRFRIIKRLGFGQQGLFAYRPETTSQVAQRVVGLRSNLDSIPPLGWMARRIAKNKLQEQAPATKQYTKNKVETKAEERFEAEVQKFLDELEGNLTQNLLRPMIAMDLEPDPIQTTTYRDQIVMRYRLSGRDQMASNTARPREIPDSLMSLQIHESAINNIVQRFGVAGKKFTTDELVEYIRHAVGPKFIAEDHSKRKQAEFEFAPFDPFRIDFEEGQVALSFNLKSFRIGKGKRWKNVNIKATYDPHVVDGFQVGMIQSETGLRVKGRQLNVGDTIAIGLICEVFFPEQFNIALVPDSLAKQLKVNSARTTQFVVSNGWIGLSLDDHTQSRFSPGIVDQTYTDKINQANQNRHGSGSRHR